MEGSGGDGEEDVAARREIGVQLFGGVVAEDSDPITTTTSTTIADGYG